MTRNTIKTARIAAIVRPLFTDEEGVIPTFALRDDQGDFIRVTSRTAAVRACRKAGYRVLTVGGLVELHMPDDTNNPAEWVVTVHFEAQ